MTLSLTRESGKGDRRRATQNDEAYRSNYDSIFGKKTKGEPQVVAEDNEDATEVSSAEEDQNKT